MFVLICFSDVNLESFKKKKHERYLLDYDSNSTHRHFCIGKTQGH